METVRQTPSGLMIFLLITMNNYKMEPGEPANVPAEHIFQLVQEYLTPTQIGLLAKNVTRVNKPKLAASPGAQQLAFMY